MSFARSKSKRKQNTRRPKRTPPPPPPPPQSAISQLLGLEPLETEPTSPGLSPYIIQGFLRALVKHIEQQATIKTTNKSTPISLTPRMCQEKYTYNIEYPQNANVSKKSYKITDYAPKAFNQLRRLCNITNQQYLQSIKTTYGGMEGEGKSGMLFFRTKDQRYVLKTLKTTELPVMLSLLPEYIAHLDKHRCSLLPRLYGLTTFYFPATKERYILIVMENVLRPKSLHSGWFSRQPKVHEIYDLKGSTKGRVVGRKMSSTSTKNVNQNISQAKQKESSGPEVLKDLDCQRRLVMDPKRRNRFFKQLRSDVNLLIRHNLMDYSLLMGVSFHGGSDAYRSASSSMVDMSNIGNDFSNKNNSSNSNSNSNSNNKEIEETLPKVPLQAVVNRVFGASSRMDELLPPSTVSADGSKYVIQCIIDGRSIVRQRGVSPHVVYHIKMTKITTTIGRWTTSEEKESWTVYRRYTDFLKLRTTLNSELSVTGYSTMVPLLPPKVWLGNFDANVLNTRSEKLYSWLSLLLQAFSSSVCSSLSIKTFLTRNADEPPLGMSRRKSNSNNNGGMNGDGEVVPMAAKQSMRVARATDIDSGSRVTLYLGVIDILQTFNLTKRMEASIKGRLSHPMAVSATDAQSYGTRFVEYLSTVLPPK